MLLYCSSRVLYPWSPPLLNISIPGLDLFLKLTAEAPRVVTVVRDLELRRRGVRVARWARTCARDDIAVVKLADGHLQPWGHTYMTLYNGIIASG